VDRLRQYRFLIIVCALAVFAGLWEFTHNETADKSRPGQHAGAPQIPELPPDRKVFANAFPDTSNAAFDVGLEYYNRRDYVEAERCFRQALADGVKTNEDLLWYYAMALLYTEADEVEIDAAVANWQRNFPHGETLGAYRNPYWTYAFQLMVTKAKPEKVQAAISRWELKRPAGSELPDLRNPPRDLFQKRVHQ
jgi:hypothetical protein